MTVVGHTTRGVRYGVRSRRAIFHPSGHFAKASDHPVRVHAVMSARKVTDPVNAPASSSLSVKYDKNDGRLRSNGEARW